MKKQGMQGENDRYFSSVAAVTLTKYVSYSRSFMLIRIAQCKLYGSTLYTLVCT